MLCSLAELRTFLLTQPAIKRVRMTLEDEAKWQMCEKRARLPIIEALLQSDPSNKEECKFAFEQFADDVYVARIHAVMGKRYGGGLLWQSLKQSRVCPREIVDTPLAMADMINDKEMNTKLQTMELKMEWKSIMPQSESLSENEHGVSFKCTYPLHRNASSQN